MVLERQLRFLRRRPSNRRATSPDTIAQSDQGRPVNQFNTDVPGIANRFL